MKTLVIGNQKGGVGKTTVCVHLARYFAEHGLRVGLVDLDYQRGASMSLERFAGPTMASELFSGESLPPLELVHEGCPVLVGGDAELLDVALDPEEAAGRLRDRLAELAGENLDLMVVDTAPSLGVPLLAALRMADWVLCPAELEVQSIQGLERMMTTIAHLQEEGAGVQFLGVVPNRVDMRLNRQRQFLKEIQSAYKKNVLPPLGLRDSYAEARAEGMSLRELKKAAANTADVELQELAKQIAKRMGIKVSRARMRGAA